VSDAVSRLVLGKDATHCFFATNALKIAGSGHAVPDWRIETACTNGEIMRYNPDFVSGLDDEEGKGLVVHEVFHCCNKHHSRRGNREPRRWNKACDLSANPVIRAAGFKLPKGGIFPGEGQYAHLPVGLSAEDYYARLSDDPAKSGADGGDDPGGCGGVEDPGDGSPADCRESDADWEVNVAQAHQVAKQRGSLPGGLEDMVQKALAPDVSVADCLWEFISRHARNDYSWAAPNRRFLSQGICLPGMQSDELGNVVCMVDGSGSCWDPRIIRRFADLLQGVLETFDCELTIIYHDIPVHAIEAWKSTDGPLTLNPRGGGGTSHLPAFRYIEDNHLEPTCVVALTDCETTFPPPSEYPTLWCCVGNPSARVPFGTLIHVE